MAFKRQYVEFRVYCGMQAMSNKNYKCGEAKRCPLLNWGTYGITKELSFLDPFGGLGRKLA